MQMIEQKERAKGQNKYCFYFIIIFVYFILLALYERAAYLFSNIKKGKKVEASTFALSQKRAQTSNLLHIMQWSKFAIIYILDKASSQVFQSRVVKDAMSFNKENVKLNT